MWPDSAAPAAREHPLTFEEHHSRGNLLHGVGPDWASSLRLHSAQFPSSGLLRGENRMEGGGCTGIARE
jgi:hypothetical protein